MGEPVVLHGHGLRERQLWGPARPHGKPEAIVIQTRRYACQRCGAVTTVAPAETLTKRLYSAAAIVWGLALFGLSLLSPVAVREAVSPWPVVGHTSAARWMTLRRWCRAAAEGRLFHSIRQLAPSGTSRQMAEVVAVAISAYAIPSPSPPSLDVLAFQGAARAR
jgi:hypothetical protein